MMQTRDRDGDARRRRASRRRSCAITTRGDAVQDRSIAAIGTRQRVRHRARARAARAAAPTTPCTRARICRARCAGDMALAAVTAREDARDAFCSERYRDVRRAAARRAGRDVVAAAARAAARAAPGPRLRRRARQRRYAAAQAARRRVRRDRARLRGAQPARRRARRYTVPFAVDALTPAVGQGALGIETRARRRRSPRVLDGGARATRRRRSRCAPSARFCARCAAAARRRSDATRRGRAARLAIDGAIAAPDGTPGACARRRERRCCGAATSRAPKPLGVGARRASCSPRAARRCSAAGR